MKRLPFVLLILILALAACSNGDEENEPRPTQIVVITTEPTIEALQMTNEALQTQVALNTTPLGATATPQATNTSLPTQIGVITMENADVLAAPDMDAEVVANLPLSTEVIITAQTEPRRGIIFYAVEFEEITGWVMSTQMQPADAAPPTENAVVPSPTTNPSRPGATSTLLPTVTNPPTTTPTRTPTILPTGFPTPEVYSVVVVEQIFERGRMLWLQPIRQIWVLTGDDIDPNEGTWECYEDTFVEGQQERDPAFEPPSNTVTASILPGAIPSQPIRGFGKVWRENRDVRDALGWALTSETQYTTRYEYVAGGTVSGNQFTPGPGEYRVDSLYQYTLVLSEDIAKAPCQRLSGEWEIRQ